MRINIYLSTNTENKLTDIRKKYHVSLSTIAQILLDCFKPNFIKYDSDFFITYKDTEHRNRTSIKPNNIDENSDIMQYCKGELSAISHIISNLLYYYSNEDYEYLFQEQNKNKIEKWKKEIEKEFFKRKEIYWNYNKNLRQQIRIVRKNADYFKRILNA